MKYVKPIMSVIELQLNENIAAVPTTVFKGSTRAGAATGSTVAYDMAITKAGSGTNANYSVSDN